MGKHKVLAGDCKGGKGEEERGERDEEEVMNEEERSGD